MCMVKCFLFGLQLPVVYARNNIDSINEFLQPFD